jgi:hypothetical protein
LRAPFDKYLRASSVMLSGLALGFVLTAAALNSGYGFGPLRVGPWTAWPQTGGPDIDPFARAALARRGEAPLGKDQGLMFVAETDSAGARLDARCEYRISDPLPSARFWTLGLASQTGAPLTNPTDRYGYTSSGILRREGGAFDISVARNARPGNWLSPGNGQAFLVVLRLYETPLDPGARFDPSTFPSITKLACA